jgi:hypothetical protein
MMMMKRSEIRCREREESIIKLTIISKGVLQFHFGSARIILRRDRVGRLQSVVGRCKLVHGGGLIVSVLDNEWKGKENAMKKRRKKKKRTLFEIGSYLLQNAVQLLCSVKKKGGGEHDGG